MRWRQARSIHLSDEHGCVQLVDAGGETTRRREPRGVSGTLEVSPTGSIPRRENPAGKSPKIRSKPLGPRFATGKVHQREYGHGHASPDPSVKENGDQNQISRPKVHGTRGRRRRRHDRFRLRFRLVTPVPSAPRGEASKGASFGPDAIRNRSRWKSPAA